MSHYLAQNPSSTGHPSNLAAWQHGSQAPFTISQTEFYAPGPDELLIKNAAIALNRIDHAIAIHAAFPLPYPAILGACIAGIVERVGSSATVDDGTFEVGDRVAAYTAYYARKDHKDNRFGAFQLFSLCKRQLVVKIGEYDFTAAASIIASAPLAVVALDRFLNCPLEKPGRDDAPTASKRLLVNGGGTSIGGFITQLASEAGYSVTCTASATHHEHLIRRLGASNAVDRHSPQLVEDLIWGGPYDAFIDCVATERTVGMLKEVAWRTSAKNKAIEILTLRPVQETKCDLKKIGTMETISTRFIWLTSVFVDQCQNRFTTWLFSQYLQSRFSSQSLVPTEPKVVQGGLEGLRIGLDLVEGCTMQKVVIEI